MKVRKKPVVVDAWQWEGTSKGFRGAPDWIDFATMKGELYFYKEETLMIRTLEGAMTASVGDYIIRGVNHELYACKPEIFDLTYDVLENQST